MPGVAVRLERAGRTSLGPAPVQNEVRRDDGSGHDEALWLMARRELDEDVHVVAGVVGTVARATRPRFREAAMDPKQRDARPTRATCDHVRVRIRRAVGVVATLRELEEHEVLCSRPRVHAGESNAGLSARVGA